MSIREDFYCWYCHHIASIVFCSTCGLGYDLKCAEEFEEKVHWPNPDLPQLIVLEKCQQCVRISRSFSWQIRSSLGRNYRKSEQERLNAVLGKVLYSGIQSIPEALTTSFPRRRLTDLIMVIDFPSIERKIINSEYRCPEEMIFDLRKIEHLVMVRLGICRATEQMVNYINLLILRCLGVDKCTHCSYDHFFRSYGQVSSCPWHRESNTRSARSRAVPYLRPAPRPPRVEQSSSPPPPAYSPQPERRSTRATVRRTRWVPGRGEQGQEIGGRSVRTDVMFRSADNEISSP